MLRLYRPGADGLWRRSRGAEHRWQIHRVMCLRAEELCFGFNRPPPCGARTKQMTPRHASVASQFSRTSSSTTVPSPHLYKWSSDRGQDAGGLGTETREGVLSACRPRVQETKNHLAVRPRFQPARSPPAIAGHGRYGSWRICEPRVTRNGPCLWTRCVQPGRRLADHPQRGQPSAWVWSRAQLLWKCVGYRQRKDRHRREPGGRQLIRSSEQRVRMQSGEGILVEQRPDRR